MGKQRRNPIEPLLNSVIEFLQIPATQEETVSELVIERSRVFEIFLTLERQKRIHWNASIRKFESKSNI